ncbi:MAG: Nif3-like dinuclear metal center hexameric protein [Clostridia bacterium]|nr:Nif3-like dinuclear metal center hexameric protein [Clostridia bacterium]
MQKHASVKTVYEWLNEIAPFETAEHFDNVGLLIGSMHAPVERVLVALDATPQVVQEALDLDVQLIVTHHPLMFGGTKRILYDNYEGGIVADIIQNNLHLIAAHTNLDLSPEYSGTACLSRKLGLENVRQEGFVFVGDLPDRGLDASLLREKIAAAENDAVYLFGDANAHIKTLGICGGAYDGGFEQARSMGAQAYLTGEVKHHNALAAAGTGFVLYQGGHFGTENALVKPLAQALQNHLNELQYSVTVYASSCYPYGTQRGN